MTIEDARKIIGGENIQYSDDQILEFIDTAKLFSEIFFEEIKKMTPKEFKDLSRKKLNPIIKH